MSNSVVVKSDLVTNVHKRLGISQREAKEFVDLFFEEMRLVLESHEDVKLSGFGNYIIRHKQQREGRNPKTGVSAVISERYVVTFKASNKFRQRLRVLKD